MDRNLVRILNLHGVPARSISEMKPEETCRDMNVRLQLSFDDKGPDVFIDEARALELAYRLRRESFYELAEKFDAALLQLKEYGEWCWDRGRILQG